MGTKYRTSILALRLAVVLQATGLTTVSVN